MSLFDDVLAGEATEKLAKVRGKVCNVIERNGRFYTFSPMSYRYFPVKKADVEFLEVHTAPIGVQ